MADLLEHKFDQGPSEAERPAEQQQNQVKEVSLNSDDDPSGLLIR